MRHETLAGQPRIPTEVSAMTAASLKQPAYLKIANVWKAFGEFHALKDISLDISEGEFICFLGPSGCGKTTLLRAIAGLDLQTRGSIHQGGRDVSTLPPSQRDYGIVFQSYALFPNLTIAKNIAFGLENTKRPRAEIEQRVAELLKLVGLPDQGNKYPAQLSGGQQQRIALARALVFDPKLVLMDEPLGALDKQLREHMQFEIKHLHESLGITVVYVTHDQGEALTMSDRVAVFNDGKIQQLAPPADLYERPDNSFVAQFIGENNKLLGTIEELNGDKALVRLSTGELIDATAVNVKEKGDKTLVSIRPERVEFKPEIMPPGAHMIGAEVVEIIYMGDILRVVLKVAGSDGFVMKMRNTLGQTKLSPGQKIKVGWHPQDARALDP